MLKSGIKNEQLTAKRDSKATSVPGRASHKTFTTQNANSQKLDALSLSVERLALQQALSTWLTAAPPEGDYLGRIMQPWHGVKRASCEEEGRDKRTENIPLKTAMVSSPGLGKTILHQKHTHAHKKTPLQSLSARCICYHGSQPRQPLSCLSGLGRERDSQYVSLACSWSSSRRVCVCVRESTRTACERSCTHGSSPGFKTLYTDRGSSHNMNHLVTRAELEMSRLISDPSCLRGHCTICMCGRRVKEGEICLKERSWDSVRFVVCLFFLGFFKMQTDIYCIGEKQWCTISCPAPTESSATLLYCLSLVGSGAQLLSKSRAPALLFFVTTWPVDFHAGLFACLAFHFLPNPVFSDWTGMLLPHSGKTLTWPSREARQSIRKKQNQKNCKTKQTNRETVQESCPKNSAKATC